MSFNEAGSKGLMVNSRGSGALMVANCCSGVGVP